ncbi:alkaline phosphatase family protein [Actinopolyspora erythraea]|uniref:Alkaline phosphatase family protein n=1 Tax=Actinopolyspora erythraea TaxID=414996 RepID=A0A099D172_9ACTN|nr:alkaline phosphatase family protein [Actinopolyspora erythraea]ASU77747.1 alkaline phosphatase family protein [Actinopolyspora erythraea]KGI79953.1 phosphodiesterase [Actinopolyspora erythraea]
MDWIVAPDAAEWQLADTLPSALGAMGTAGFTDRIGLPECSSAAVLLIDGLGWRLLREYAADAPTLTELDTARPGAAGFPTTTATSIASLGTGCCSGEHGVVGYSFAEPGGALLRPLSWTRRNGSGQDTSMLASWPPEEVQPKRTVPQRAVAAGVDTRLVVPAEFEGTGLTRAALRGGDVRGVHALGDLAAQLLAAMAEPAPVLCYGYHGQLDMLGHVHGPGSPPWRMQLRQVDRLVESVAERLPAGSQLLVVADHGMVPSDPDRAPDFDTDEELARGVRLVGGEVRVRHVYTEPGATPDVLATWREKLGSDAVVVTAEEAVEAGWFGAVISEGVRARIGDVIALARHNGVIRSSAEPNAAVLLGQHGSLTADEQYVPLLLARG